MRRLLLAVSVLGAALAVVPLPLAEAKAKAKKLPTVKLVSPMRVTVGRTLTMRGKHFSPRRRRNTVIFKSPSGRTAFAKPRRASRKRLVLKVPGSVERLLSRRGTKAVPTRFRLRVVVGRTYGEVTPRRRSPVIVSAAGTGIDVYCGPGDDADHDLLKKAEEKLYKTDPCLADTDLDGVEDGFEVTSGRHLNQRAVPSPGKRPFANALDPSDSNVDYDGDGLASITEFRAWAHPPTSPAASLLQSYTANLRAPAFGGPYGGQRTYFEPRSLTNMLYSDGLQASRPNPPEAATEMAYLDFEYDPATNFAGDGVLTDDERDVDGDGLRNVDEVHTGAPVDYALLMQELHYPESDDCKWRVTPILPRPFLEPDYLDPDSDGDGIWDGNDDQDNDDVSNVDEIKPPWTACDSPKIAPLPFGGSRDGSVPLRNPYNPCAPYRSDVCSRYYPAG